MRYALVVVLVMLLLNLFTKNGRANRGQTRQDPNVTPEHFVIRQYGGILATGLYVLTALCLGLLMMSIGAKWGTFMTVMFGGLTVLCILPLISLNVWQIAVDGDRLRIRSSFGSVRELDIHDVRRVTAKPQEMGINEYSYKFFSADGTKLFSIDENTDDIYLLQRLMELGVEIEYLAPRAKRQ